MRASRGMSPIRHGTDSRDRQTGGLPDDAPRSAVFSIKSRDFTRRLAIDGALFQIRPLITGDLAMPHPELSFHFAIFPIELENDQRAAFHLCFAIQLVDLLAM